jgi:hypothetical protein
MGFLLSFLIGFGILRILTGKNTFRAVDLFFSWGLGVGLASQITFYSILIGGRYKQELLFCITFIIIFAIWFFLLKKKQVFRVEPSGLPVIAFLAVLLPLVIAQKFIYSSLPYGDWDGWSLWNYRANSLFRSVDDWLPVYHNAIQGMHPWLLPQYIVWGWSFTGKETTWVPALTAFFMSCATVGLLVYALVSSIGRLPAILAGAYLISIPYFNWHAASQYASIFVAFYFLGSVIALREYLREPSFKYAMAAGSFMAFLANSKDEGILLTVLMLVLLKGFFKKQNAGHGKIFITVFAALMVMFVLTEVFMRCSMGMPSLESKYYLLDPRLVLDPGQWKVLIVFMWRLFFLSSTTGGIIFFLLLLALSQADRCRRAGRTNGFHDSILRVIGIFFLIFSVLYIVVTTDLDWRLNVTANRMFFIFAPTLVYLVFGALYKYEE